MPRKPRFKLASVLVHVVQRGNNRQAVFYDEQDHRDFKGPGSNSLRRVIAIFLIQQTGSNAPRSRPAPSRLIQRFGSAARKIAGSDFEQP